MSVSNLPSLAVSPEFCIINKKTNWKCFSSDQKELYETFTDLHLSNDNLNAYLPVCTDCNCKCIDHLDMLTNAYEKLNSVLLSSSEKVTKTKPRKVSLKPKKPGWSEFVHSKYIAAIIDLV